jgi:Na+-driven multidrug efflux pump
MKDLSTGSIPRHIATMSIQMGIGILVQTLYFFTDLYFVAKLGDTAIAGVTSAGNVWFIVLALTQILNVGTVALVSHAVGAKQQERANLVFNQSLSLSFAMGAVVFVGVYLASGHYMNTVAADDPRALLEAVDVAQESDVDRTGVALAVISFGSA